MHTVETRTWHGIMGTSIVLALAISTPRATAAEPAPKPAWLTEASVATKLAFDTNVYAVELNHPTVTVAEVEDWAMSVCVRLAADGSAWVQRPKGTLTASYSPTWTRFDEQRSETHTVHKLTLGSTGKEGAWSWLFDGTVNYVDGSEKSPFYGIYSSYGMAVSRERREQVQQLVKAQLKYQPHAVFARWVVNYVNYDLLTDHHAPTGPWAGYLNYVDRSDLHTGLDVGRTFKATTVFAGARAGTQYQQQVPWANYSGSNDYTRLLVGLEHKFFPAVSLSLCAGPDFRDYADARSAANQDPTVLYAEGALQAKFKAESVSLTAKQWRWVASSGKAVYNDKSAALTWKHTFSPAWSSTVALNFYRSSYVAPIVRKEQLYQLTLGAGYQFAENWSVAGELSWHRCENFIDLASAEGREYERTLGGITAKLTF